MTTSSIKNNERLVDALEGLMVKAARYLPQESSTPCFLPVTMRDIVEGHFEGTLYEGPPEAKNIVCWSAACLPKRSLRPISAKDLDRRFAVNAGNDLNEELDDFRGYAPLLTAFWNWLQINEPNNSIEIDHLLEDDNFCCSSWPLFNYLKDLVKEKTGFNFSVLFPQEEMEECHDEKQLYDRAIFEIYLLGNGQDEEPLVDFLNWFTGWGGSAFGSRIVLPEAAFEAAESTEEANMAMHVFLEILRSGRTQLLEKNWKTALDRLKEISISCIAVEDTWQQAYIQIEDNPEDIDHLFEIGRTTFEMLGALDPLIQEHNENITEFWSRFIRKMNYVQEKDSTFTPIAALTSEKTKCKAK